MSTIITDTAANYSMDAAVYQQMEYEQRPYKVLCDICCDEGYGSERHLKRQGWFLGNGAEICPSHD